MSQHLIRQNLYQEYGELGYQWNSATQVVNLSNSEVISRQFSLLEFNSDYRAALVNSPPEPAPFYEDGEEVAQKYFLVLRSFVNRVYQGSKILEFGAEEFAEGHEFKSWICQESTYDLRRIYLDQEVDYIVWKPTDPPEVDPGDPLPPPDDRYELYRGETFDRYTAADLDILTLSIPNGIWGISSSTPGAFLVDAPDQEIGGLELTSDTILLNHPYLQLRKAPLSEVTFRISLRGKASKYLADNLIPVSQKDVKFLRHAQGKLRRDRLTPPNILVDANFPTLEGTSLTQIQNRVEL